MILRGQAAVRILVLAGTLVAGTARAAAPLEDLLYSAATPADLRERLAAYAQRSGDPAEAARAHLRRGESFARSARADSAIACFRLAAGSSREARLALIDALLLRRADGDTQEATALLESTLSGAEGAGDPGITGYVARLAWARHLDGKSTEAASQLVPLVAGLRQDPRWRYRLSRVAFGAADHRSAYELMRPLLVQSRRQDKELEEMLGEIGRQTGRQGILADDVARGIAEHDVLEADVLRGLGARRVRFPARDGEYISAMLLPEPARRRPAPAIVVMAPGDSVADYDSLATALHHAGYAVMLVEPRGTGWSVSPSCPLPDTWEGRQELLQSRVAHDVVDALAALHREMQVDTARAIALGVGAMAPVIAEAAEIEPRFAALVLVSPAAAWVDRGTMLHRLRRAQRPLFLQAGAEDLLERAFLDSVYQTAAPRESRFVESRRVGSGVRQFGGEPGVCARLIRWAADVTAPRRTTRPMRRP